MKFFRQITFKADRPGVKKLNQLSDLINQGWEIEKYEKIWDNSRGCHYLVYILSKEENSLLDNYPGDKIK